MAWSDEMRKRAPVNLTDLGLYLLAVGVVAYAFFAIYLTRAVLPSLLAIPGVAFLLPASRAKLGINPGLAGSTLVTLALLVTIGGLAGTAEDDRENAAQLKREQESAARIATLRAERAAEFSQNKLKILVEIERQLADNQFREAATTINKFMLVTKDPDVGRLQYRADLQVMRLDLKENEAGLSLERRSAIYTAMMAEEPAKREEYQAKLKVVEATLEAQRQEQQKAAMRASMQAGLAGQFSSFDGSHRNVEKVLKAGLKDPSSYQHVSTSYVVNETTITVYTTYRAKNSFNALITGLVTATVDANGNVLSLN